MGFAYPKFHGSSHEDVVEFLEKMEIACISNQIQDLAQRLRLLQLCLKGDAWVCSRTFEEGLRKANPPVQLDWDNLKEALEIEFVKIEDADKEWQEVQGLFQKKSKHVKKYIHKFSLT